VKSKTGSLLYSQLSSQQKLVLSKESADVLVADQFGSFTGPKENLPNFQKALSILRIVVEGFAIAEAIVVGYIRVCNGQSIKSKGVYRILVTNLNFGFLQFLREKGSTDIAVVQIDTEMVSDFLLWLKSGERGLSDGTAKQYFSIFRRILERLREERYKLAADLSFPRNPFPDAHSSVKKTRRLDDITYGKVIRACMSEIDLQLNVLLPAWESWDSDEMVEPDDTKKGSGRYSDIRAVWTWVRRNVPAGTLLPTLEDIEKTHPDVSDAVQNHRASNVTRPFYPSPEGIFPFILLLFVYTFANAEPLFGLLQSGVDEQEVMGIRRTVLDLYKNRSDTYQRTFAKDESDRFSPEQLLKVIERWTGHIRPLAGSHPQHIFLFATNRRRVRGFCTIEHDGVSSDVAWNAAVGRFCSKYDLPKIQTRIVRTTGLDVTRELHDDDILAVSAVAGTKAGATLEFHYEGEPTKLRRAEKLLPVMVAYERWAYLGGKPDTRRTPGDSDVLAATPGWGCLDPFASPIPGEREGRSCQAMGRCPACPLGFLDLTSPYALARAVQLADELKAARYYLDHSRWKAAYERALQYLLKKWLPAFTSPEVIEAAKKFSLSPIGRVE
jgi:Phage integrase SAM-like domain